MDSKVDYPEPSSYRFIVRVVTPAHYQRHDVVITLCRQSKSNGNVSHCRVNSFSVAYVQVDELGLFFPRNDEKCVSQL